MNPLRELVYSIINSFLGPNKSNKFLFQDKDTCITRCPLVIFQNVHFQNPISSLVEETLFSHHDLYGCSTLSLLAMWYLWNEEFISAIDEGCDIQDIIKHSQNILEEVILAVSNTATKFDTMISKQHTPVKKVFNTKNVSMQVPISIQYSSRHFSPAGNLLSLESTCEFNECCKPDEKSLKRAIQCLNHDEDVQLSDLILECWKLQASSSSYSKFDASGIHVCPIVLPSSSSTVIDGLVIKSYINNCNVKNIYSNRSLLIKGGITYEYIHLGFSPKVKISVQKTSLRINKDAWIRKNCEYIKKLNLDILLIKDDIEQEIADFCFSHSILVLSHIPLTLFKKLCNALQYSPCTYIMDCYEKDVIKTLEGKLWKPKDAIILREQYFLIRINSESMVKFQTIILCHPCQAVLQSTEHYMHHFISRLSLSSESNALLPGGGLSEKWCDEFLNKLSQSHDLSDQKSRIMKALANGFKNYAVIISQKKSLCTNESEILDEMSSKLNAWRSALSLLLLTLQCNSVIINGVDDLCVHNLCIDTL